MRLLIAGGGTGGHIFPALAVARSLGATADPPELSWLGGHRGLEASLVAAAGIPLRRLVLRSLRSVDRDVHLVLDPLRLGASVPQATAILASERPAAIFTTGGYVAIPTLLGAAALRIPVVLWEGNVIPGRSTRTIARLADIVAVSFAATCGRLGGAGGAGGAGGGRPCYVTGTPIREVAGLDRGAARERFGIPLEARLLLVFGGSQAVRRFDGAVAGALPGLLDRAWLIQVTGTEGQRAALERRDRLPAPLRERYRPYDFLGEDMLAALVAADLVVGRAGSSTLAEVAALGRPMIVVPYPHAGGHQASNGRILADAGAAILIADEDFGPASLEMAGELLEDEPGLAAMAAAARSLGRPGAAAAVAELVRAVAERRPLPDASAVEAIARGAAA